MSRGRLLDISDFGLDLVTGEISKPVDERSNERVPARSFATDPSEPYFISTSTTNQLDSSLMVGLLVNRPALIWPTDLLHTLEG